MRVVLGVAGGIAAYKACALLRLLTENGHDVTVVPTASALNFVGAATWSALSGKPARSDVWSDAAHVPHVHLGQDADLVVVAPATADLLGRAAHGLADDLLTNVLLTARCPVVMAPAMHTEMWEHPATQANVDTLSSRGIHIIPPSSGRLTGADSGPGRLPEPDEIYSVCARLLGHGAATNGGVREGDWQDVRVVVSAGGTREPLDPVRFLGNRSSGKQGYAIAQAAADRGARVTLVSANVSLPDPAGADIVRVGTAAELADAMGKEFDRADVVIMAAAVADFRPASVAAGKIKKDPQSQDAPTIELVRNPDVLAGLVQRRAQAHQPLIVGFAAETGDPSSVVELGREKLLRKGCDVLVVNEVGFEKVFGTDENTVTILQRDDADAATVGPASKRAIADAILDTLQQVRVNRQLTKN